MGKRHFNVGSNKIVVMNAYDELSSRVLLLEYVRYVTFWVE